MSDTKVSCTYCQMDLSTLYIRCMACDDYLSCLLCFSHGAEIGPHKNNHPYKFETTEETVELESGWNLDEKVKLLDAIENFGYGNWDHIATLVGTRTAEEVQKEYENEFVNGSIGSSLLKLAKEDASRVIDHSVEDDGPFGQAAMSKLPPLNITPKQAASLGYMPLRDDYDKEFDDNAEQMISSLSLSDDPDDLNTALQVTLVDIYLRKLGKRARKKSLAREYQLAEKFFEKQKQRGRKASKSTKSDEFEEKFRRFAQLISEMEFRLLLTSLRREDELKRRFKELATYRRNGLTTYAECEQFNKLRLGEPSTSTASNRESSAQCRTGLRSARGSAEDQVPSKPSTSSMALQSALSSSSSGLIHSNSLVSQKNLELLSDSEIKLCEEINYCASDYIRAKTIFSIDGASEQESPEMDKIKSFLTSVDWL